MQQVGDSKAICANTVEGQRVLWISAQDDTTSRTMVALELVYGSYAYQLVTRVNFNYSNCLDEECD